MRKGKGATVGLALLGVVAMSGLVAASVPIYRLYCKLTGYGGTPRITAAAAAMEPGRPITVRFDASVAKSMPWRFTPDQRQITVRLGEDAIAFFTATNTSSEPITGQATFNVTPDKTGRYFDKVQCFCFTEQRLEPGQTVHMPVTFHVDPKLAEDPHTSEVGTITLSYTFFRRESGS